MRFCFLLLLSIIPCSLFAQESLRNLKIAYNVYYDTAQGNYEIFVMDADGSNKRNISNWKGIDWVYAGSGDKIYFVSDRDTTYRKYQLFEMDADGNNLHKITNYIVDDSNVGIRKNGTELIIASRKDGKRAFYIIDRNGKEIRKIVPPGLENFNDPMFMPVTGQIVFRGATQSAFKTRKRNNPVSNDELYKMNEDGTGLTQLTFYPPADSTPEWHRYHAGPPRWNAKEKFISYMSFQNGRFDLFGTKPEKPSVFSVWHGELEPGYHDWSPDGAWLVTDLSRSNEYDIYLINYATKKSIRLTDDWRYEQAPVFVKSAKK